MDNDREVNSLVTRTKGLFLKDLGREFQDRQKRYDLDEEFAKTKKNRSPFVVIAVTAITVILTVVSILIAVSIDEAAQNMDVGLGNAFADVNLKDVLDTVKRNETEMEQARRALRDLIDRRDTALATAQQRADQEIRLIESQDLTAVARSRAIAAVQERLPAELQRIHQEYDPQIAEAEARIAEIQARIDQYDARQLQLARQQEERLNAQQRIFELERDQLIAQHQQEVQDLTTRYTTQLANLQAFSDNLERNLTARFRAERSAALAEQKLVYNPVFVGPVLQAISGAPANPEPLTSAPTIDEGIYRFTGSEFSARLQASYQKLETIFQRLDQIPYENSIPGALSTIKTDVLTALRIHREVQDVLARAVEGFQAELAELEQLSDEAVGILTKVNYSLQEVARTKGDSGYILDPRDTENILVFTANPDLLSAGMVGLVYREDSRQIGTVRITKVGVPSYAALESLTGGEKLAPFDSLVFNFQGSRAINQ